MADSIPLSGVLDLTPKEKHPRLWLEVMHDWIVTTDHKKIGLMYIAASLMFFLVGGVEILLIRIQLAKPECDLPFAGTIQSTIHAAWDHHDFLCGYADHVRVWELPGAVNDWRPRHGVSATERVQFLDIPLWRAVAVLQPIGRQRTLRWRLEFPIKDGSRMRR